MGNHFDWDDVPLCEVCGGRPCVCRKAARAETQKESQCKSCRDETCAELNRSVRVTECDIYRPVTENSAFVSACPSGTILRIGILPLKEFQARTIAHVKREYDLSGEPKKWYYSLSALGQLLSEENLNLLRIIQEQKPETLKELAELSGRKLPSISRTMRSLEVMEIVTLTKEGKQVRPTVNVTGFQIEIDLKRLT